METVVCLMWKRSGKAANVIMTLGRDEAGACGYHSSVAGSSGKQEAGSRKQI